jgi:predicted DNA binding CopG/RHH family protein
LDAPNGENSGDYMKQPKLSDLEVDLKATKNMRNKAAQGKKIKITINIEESILSTIRDEAKSSGVPYQNLVNRLLEHALASKNRESDRLARLEKEVRALKKKLSA